MKGIIKKVAKIVAIASLPAFAIADVAVGVHLYNTKKGLKNEQKIVLADFRKSDEFNKSYTKKYNELQVEFDEEKISESKFKQDVEKLESDSYAKEILYKFGSQEDIEKFENAGAKVKDYDKVIDNTFNGMVAGTALTAFAFTAAALTSKKENSSDNDDEDELTEN